MRPTIPRLIGVPDNFTPLWGAGGLGALFFLINFNFTLAQSQSTYEWQWAKRGGGNANFETRAPTTFYDTEHVRDIRIDAQGNRYFLAIIGGDDADIDSTTVPIIVPPRQGWNILVWSTDCQGTLRWSKTIGSESVTEDTGLSIDGSGNVYISGKVSPRFSVSGEFIHFDTDVVVTTNLDATTAGPHNRSIFLIKYDTNGVFQWLQLPEEDNIDLTKFAFNRAFAHTTEANGTSHFLVRLTAGSHLNGAYTSTGNEMVILRFDAAGNYLGHVPIGLWYPGVILPFGKRIIYDAPRNRYLISANRPNTSNDPDRMLLDGQTLNAFTVLFSVDATTGATQWFETNSIGSAMFILELEIDSTGNIYITGGGGKAARTVSPTALPDMSLPNIDRGTQALDYQAPFL